MAKLPTVPEAPIKLSKPDQLLLAEALRLGEEARDAMEDALVGYGNWLLVHVFGNDAAQALEDHSQNLVWLELLRRAGGPTLRLNRRLLSVAVHIAAHDRRINDGSWKALDAGRKELLLPLRDEPSMREAAQHVLATKLSHEATRQYVASLREAAGRPRPARLTGPRVASRLRKLRESMGSASARRRLERLARELEGEDRDALVAEVDALKSLLVDLSRQLKQR